MTGTDREEWVCNECGWSDHLTSSCPIRHPEVRQPVIPASSSGREPTRSRPIPEWAEPVIALGENVQQGRCGDCGLHVWLWLCVRYDDDGERHQPRCEEMKAAAVEWLNDYAKDARDA